MGKFLFIILSLVHFGGISQESDAKLEIKTEPKIHRHELTVSPISVWFNKGAFIGHHLKYRLQIKRGLKIELESDGTLIRALDRRAKHLKEDKVFPLLNQSNGLLEKDLFGKGKTINRNKQKRYISSIRLGYQFFQHSTPYENRDYWAYDSTAQEGLKSIRSFQSHSISAGLGFRAQKYKRIDGRMQQVSSHKWSMDYLGSVHYQLSSYSINDANEFNIVNIPNTYDLRKSGGRLRYQFTRYLNPFLGVHFGAEAVYVPFLSDYSPMTGSYFVPRGGERIIPLFTNVKLGVSFVF